MSTPACNRCVAVEWRITCGLIRFPRSCGVVARSFGHMHVGWYLNHSDEPNAHHARFRYFASRDIDADEEITIDYRDLVR